MIKALFQTRAGVSFFAAVVGAVSRRSKSVRAFSQLRD
jgi:hypothetical protein